MFVCYPMSYHLYFVPSLIVTNIDKKLSIHEQCKHQVAFNFID
jgi:hypothetical protein